MKSYLKTFLQAMVVGGLCAFLGLLIMDLVAQPASSLRLRDLNDVKLATNVVDGAALVYSSAARRWTNGVAGGTVGLADFNQNQFRTNGGTVSIKSGASATNLAVAGTLTRNGLTVLTTLTFPGPGVGGNLAAPVFEDSSNLVWQLDGSLTDVHLHATNLADAQIASGAAIAKYKISTNGTWPVGDIPALPESQITGLVSDLAAKQPASANLTNWSALATSAKQDALGYTPLNMASNLSDVANAETARSNIGAGTGNGTVTGTGTANKVTKFLSASVITNSLLADDGTNTWTTGTGAFAVPSGTTVQQPASPTNGMARYNTTTSRMEFYSGGAWRNHVRLDGDTMTGNLLFTDNTYDIGASNVTRPRYVWAGTGFGMPDGLVTSPGLFFAAATNTGIFRHANGPAVAVGGVRMAVFAGGINIGNAGAFTWSVNSGADGTSDTILGRESAAVVQQGVDSATPIAQTYKGADARAGTDSNVAGGNLTIAAGRNTGSGTGGSLLFQTAPAGSTGTAAGTLTTRLTIDSTGTSAFSGAVTAPSIVSTNSVTTGNLTVNSNATFALTPTVNGSPVLTNAAAGGAPANGISPVITLTMSGSNVTANSIDFNATNVCYTLLLTNNAFFGDTVCTNVPNTSSYKFIQVNLIQDSTGGRTVTFTNSIFAGVNGTFAVTTNANAYDAWSFFNSPQTNGNVIAIPVNFLHR
jgi:hypothetical protein